MLKTTAVGLWGTIVGSAWSAALYAHGAPTSSDFFLVFSPAIIGLLVIVVGTK